jgi:hypothetical protein
MEWLIRLVIRLCSPRRHSISSLQGYPLRIVKNLD